MGGCQWQYLDSLESSVSATVTFSLVQRSVPLLTRYSHQLELQRERLLALFSHSILLKIWDGKEFCTARTKLDKPRMGRMVLHFTESTSSYRTFDTKTELFHSPRSI